MESIIQIRGDVVEAIFDDVLRITDSVSYLDALTHTMRASLQCESFVCILVSVLVGHFVFNADHVYFSHMCCIKNGQPFQYKGPANSTVVAHLA